MDTEAQVPRCLWPVAVRADGRRHEGAPCFADGGALPGAPGEPILLDHAGPRAALWSPARALGASDVVEPTTGRRPQPLDEDGWRELERAFAQAAQVVRAAGRVPVLALDDDGLLQHAISPRTGAAADQQRRERALALHRACGAIDVALCVEELCPGGGDATDGIELARALHAQGAATLYASAGSHAFPPLRDRVKGGSEGDPGLALCSAAWLVGRVPARIVALVTRCDPGSITARAHALGLAGVATRGQP